MDHSSIEKRDRERCKCGECDGSGFVLDVRESPAPCAAMREIILRHEERGRVFGAWKATLEDPTSCPVCGGDQRVWIGSRSWPCYPCRRLKFRNRFRQQFTERWHKFVKDTPIPLDGFDETPISVALRDYRGEMLSGSETTILYLSSPCGTGKTHGVMSLLWDLAGTDSGEGRISVIHFPTLMRAAKDLNRSAELDRYLEEFEEARVVFVDEIGRDTTRGNRDIYHEYMRVIINESIRDKWLILATNLSKRESAEYFPVDLCSPLAGHGTIVYDESTKDYRRRGKG